jgi:hypothetical protein
VRANLVQPKSRTRASSKTHWNTLKKEKGFLEKVEEATAEEAEEAVRRL